MSKTVFVGLSGGVDSSVAAARLQARGFNVVGVFIKVWHPDWLVCNWEAERLDAMRVAAKLDIPFLTCNAEQAYKDGVADYFISEYQAGRTPNPDVLCNQQVKFGAFLEFAKVRGADYIATGHYAQVVERSDQYQLLRGVDTNKDQTYFLWTLTQEQLAHTLFPVGDTPKEQIRAEAAAAELVTSVKKDSQGVCFLGHIDIKEFLSHYTNITPGTVLDESHTPIGTHEGALIYTIGQRHGFTITNHTTSQTPHYVIKKDVVANTITVSTIPPKLQQKTSFTIAHCNFINTAPVVGDTLQIQNRYRQTPIPAIVTEVHDSELVLTPTIDSDAVAVGQSCVLYTKEVCLGGGIIVTS